MSPAATGSTDKKTCPYCEKKGLPILPLRYAVARADIGNAPKLAAPFGEGVSNIALPDKRAHYTLRLLRAGYLYVYDERYGERGWSAYQVADGGYLFPFDPYVEAPAGGWRQMHFSCSRSADQSVARCITVDDAANAKDIWMGFSDVVWTQSVLKAHASASYRNAHMRCIDVAKVRGGSNQPHATKLVNLGQRIAEYAAKPVVLAAGTAAYVKALLPTPLTHPKQLLDTSNAGKLAYKLCSALVTGLLPGAFTPKQTHGPMPAAAWAFAGHSFFADAELAASMEAFGEAQTKPYAMHAGMVALDDAAGIAMELNGLIHQLTAEFTEAPQRKWKHDTAATIKMFEHAAVNGAIEEDNKHGNSAVYAPTGEKAEFIMHDATWGKYAKLMKSKNAADEVLKQYGVDFKQYEQKLDFAALDQSYLAWLGAKPFKSYFTHNYDRKSLASGAVYSEVLGAVLHDLAGRKLILEHQQQALKDDPTVSDNLIARGLALNHDGLIQHWLAGADKAHAEGEKEQLAAAVTAVYAGWSAVMGGDPSSQRGIAKYVYQMSAAVLGNVDASIGRAWLTHKPQKRMVALMGALAKLDNPKLTLVDFHGVVTEAERAKILNQAIGKVLGKGLGMKSAATRFVKSQQVSMDTLVLIDEDKLKSGRVGGLTAQTLEETMAQTAPRLGGSVSEAGIGVVGFILTAINCKFAWHDFQTANGAQLDRQAANLLGQVTGLTGSSFDAASSILKVYSASRMGSQFATRAAAYADTAEWLTGAGRVLGGFGGIIVGTVGIFQGVDDHASGHAVLGWAEAGVGFLGILSGIALLASAVATGFIIGLVAGLLMLLIGHFKQDPVQDWIEKSTLGDRKLPPYSGQIPQNIALQTL